MNLARFNRSITPYLLGCLFGGLLACNDPQLPLGGVASSPGALQQGGAASGPNPIFIDQMPPNAQVVLTGDSGQANMVTPSGVPQSGASTAGSGGAEDGWVDCQSLPSGDAPSTPGLWVRFTGFTVELNNSNRDSLSVDFAESKITWSNLLSLTPSLQQELGNLDLRPGEIVQAIRLKMCKNDNLLKDGAQSCPRPLDIAPGSALNFDHADLSILAGKEYQLKILFDVAQSYDRESCLLHPAARVQWLESP